MRAFVGVWAKVYLLYVLVLAQHLDSEPNLLLNSRGLGLAMYIKLELGAVHGTKRSCPTLTIHHKQA